MSAATTLLRNDTRVQVHGHGQEALATVLGVCLLIIGLCAFAGVILLFQLLQRTDSSSESSHVAAVPTRRASKPTAVPAQFRPLGEGLRYRGEAARLSGGPERSAPLAGASQDVVLGTANILAADFSFARSSSDLLSARATPVPADPPMTAPVVNAAAPAAAAHGAVADTQGALAAGSLDAGPGESFTQPAAQPVTKPIDEIDIELLCRIDEALASGYMRPHQATQLLKSFGCDLEDLLKKELGEDLSTVDGADCVATRLASAPILGTRKPAVSLGNATSFISAATPTVSVQPPQRQSPSPPAVPAPNPRQSLIRSMAAASPDGVAPGKAQVFSTGPASPASIRSGSAAASKTASGVSGVMGANIDDVLLLKLDMALASGCVRPEQATQLLKSYGCDVEELLREELGDGAAGSIRRASGDLSL